MDVNQLTGVEFFGKVRGRAPTTVEQVLDALAELQGLITGAVQAELTSLGAETSAPFPPIALTSRPFSAPKPAQRQNYFAGDLMFSLTITCQACCAQPTAAGGLRSLDILADSYPASNSADVVLLKRGTVLSPQFIEKIRLFESSMLDHPSAKILRPTSLAVDFLHAGGGSRT